VKIIYIASPYTIGDVAANVRVQIEAAHLILDTGHCPVVPLLSHFLHIHRQRPYQDWTEMGLAIIPRVDIVLRLPGESRGADEEVRLAVKLGIPVAHGLDELSVVLRKLEGTDSLLRESENDAEKADSRKRQARRTSMLTKLPSGDWIEVEEVRDVAVTKKRDVGCGIIVMDKVIILTSRGMAHRVDCPDGITAQALADKLAAESNEARGAIIEAAKRDLGKTIKQDEKQV
jgi:hypothetical protein